MRHSRFISSTPLIAGLLTGLLLAILVVPLNAEDSDSRYDVSKEARSAAPYRACSANPPRE